MRFELNKEPLLYPIAALGVAGTLALLFGIALVVSLSYGIKWFVMAVAVITVLFTGLLVKDHEVFVVGLVAACIPIGIRYDLWTHGVASYLYEHRGGALPEPVIYMVDLPIMLLVLIWISDISTGKKKPPPWTRFDTLVLCFLMLSLFSLYNTTEYRLLLFEFIRYLKYYVMYWALRTYLCRKASVWGILTVSLVVLGLQSLTAIAEYFFSLRLYIRIVGTPIHYQTLGDDVLIRVGGFLGRSNVFATYLIVAVSFVLVLIFARITYFYRVALLFLFALGCLAMVLTFSRNGWLSLSLCIALVVGLAILKHRLSKVLLMTSVVVGLAAFGFLIASGLSERVLMRISGQDGMSAGYRGELNGVAFNMINQNPFFGVGLNSFEENMHLYDQSGVSNVFPDPVHNIYMLIAAETGIPSVVVFLVAGCLLVKYTYELLRINEEIPFVVGAIGFSAVISIGFSINFDWCLRWEPPVGMMTMLSAMIVSSYTRYVPKIPEASSFTNVLKTER